MPHLQIAPATEQSAHRKALIATQLQQKHAAAKARAKEICEREPHLVSVFALGEVIAQFQADQIDHGRNLEFAESITLNRVINRLKQLLPIP